MSAAAGATGAAEAAAAAAAVACLTASAAPKARSMTRKDVTCDYCDKLISECMCVTAPTHSRYCDTCGRARPYCLCKEDMCGGCDRTTADCLCGKCRKCSQASDKCVCPCPTCKYPGNACRCYEGYDEYEPHPDTLCCPHCYSDPCECEANAKQQDLNRAKDYDCPVCEENIKYCSCRRRSNSDSD